MQKISIYIIFFLGINLFCHSQDTVILKSTNLVNEDFKILYGGMRNGIKIGNYDPDANYVLSSESVEIMNLDSFFILSPHRLKHNIKVMKINNKGDTIFLDTVKYSHEEFPDFEIFFGNIRYYGKIDEILTVNEVNVYLPDCEFRLPFRVWHSELMFIISSNKVINTICGDNGKITSKQMEIMNTLTLGDKIIIHNVRGNIPGGGGLLLPAKVIEIEKEL